MIQRHSRLALLTVIFFAGIAAHLAVRGLVGSEFRGYAIGNPVYLITLTAFVVGGGARPPLGKRDLLVIVLALLLFATMGFAALFVAESSPRLARWLGGPMTAIGIYPVGADVWFPVGILIWGAAGFIVTVAGILIGFLMNKLLGRTSPNVESN